MIYKLLIVSWLYCLIFRTAEGLGERCSQNGSNGVCRRKNECASATQLYMIDFRVSSECEDTDDGVETVCCLEIYVTPAESLTGLSTIEYTSSTIDPAIESQCADLPPKYTAERTGRKAWDKCIDYQKQLIYPCGLSVALRGGYTRVNKCKHSVEPVIMGGRTASTDEFPHMVQLGFNVSTYIAWCCSGTLLSDWWILTAGHCTSLPHTIQGQSTNIPIKVTHAAIGSRWNQNRRGIPDNVYSILPEDIIKHPAYMPLISRQHDIALLKTATRMNLTPSAVPACLDVFGGDKTNVLATGWGKTETNDTSYILKKVTLYQFSDAECIKKYATTRLGQVNTTTQVCYGHRTRVADTCLGDSGGPITIYNPRVNCMYSIIGITSHSKFCGLPGYPGVYTKVAAYVPWIESIVWPDSEENQDDKIEPR